MKNLKVKIRKIREKFFNIFYFYLEVNDEILKKEKKKFDNEKKIIIKNLEEKNLKVKNCEKSFAEKLKNYKNYLILYLIFSFPYFLDREFRKR